jgi:cation diffusion facilitator CzcD-associated flavoprotein CzcO
VRYAQKHDILSRCRLGTEAVSVERAEAGWNILIRPADDADAELDTLRCNKLIVATGLNSRPRIPEYDLSKFDGISFHALEVGKRYPELLSEKVQQVTIIGGHKSALEAVGTCAQSGKKVEWLINKDGSGPTWILPSRNPDGSSFAEMASKRFPAILSPSVYHSSRQIDRFLHSGQWRLGTYLLWSIWSNLTKRLHGDIYTKSENGQKLKPDPDR